MDNVKKSWITHHDRLYMLSVESANPDVCSPNRVSIDEIRFPNEPSEQHPKRHVVTLGLLSENDLVELHNTLADAINIIRGLG